MAKARPFIPVSLGVLVGAALLLLILRGFRDQTDVPDTTSMVGVVTSDPDPRPISAGDADTPMTAGEADGGASPDATDAQPFVRPSRINGTVLDATGRPILGAQVTVRRVAPERLRGAPFDDGPVLAETRTERDGTFAFDAPVDSWLRVTASATGHATVGQLVAGTGASIVIVLPPAGALLIAVLDTHGKPVAGASVEAQVVQTALQVSTNADGLAAFEHLPPGEVRLRAGAEQHGTVRAGPYVIVAGATRRADVTLTAGVTLAGIVRDDLTGAPIPNAHVHLARPGQSTDAGRTGADGRFAATFAGGLGERIFVSVDAEGYAPALMPLVLRPLEEGRQTTEVRLKAGDPWRGEVLFPRGVEARPVTVRYSNNGVAGRPGATVQTDASGHFELPPPAPAAPGRRVVLLAEAGAYKAALALRPGQVQPSPLQLVMTLANTVRGRVTRVGGKPAPGATVRLVPRWDLGARRGLSHAAHLLRASNEAGLADLTTATDASGRWSLTGVPDGDYDRYVSWEGRGRWVPEVVEVTGPTNAGTTVLGSGIVVTGRVQDAFGTDLAGVRVRLAYRAETPRVLSVLTDIEGTFTFEDLVSGEYELRTSLAGYASRAADLTIIAGEAPPDPLDLRLDRAAAIEGILRLEGKPYRGAFRVHLRLAGRGGRGLAPTTLRTTDGHFRLPALPDGTWALKVTTAEGSMASALQPLSARAGDILRLELDLIPGGVLTGRIRTEAGQPVPAARVMLTDETSGQRTLAHAMEDGRYRLERLEAGTYTLRASGPGGVPVEQQITIDLGQTLTVDAALPVGGHVRVQAVDRAGRPLSGAVLLFRNADGTLATSPPDRTARDGRFLRRHLPVGSMTVRGRLGKLEGRLVFTIQPGTTVEVRLVLE